VQPFILRFQESRLRAGPDKEGQGIPVLKNKHGSDENGDSFFPGSSPADPFLNILLVDDSESDIEVARLVFESAKIKNRFFAVKDAAQVSAFLEGRSRFGDYAKPHLILLDIQMPTMDGFAVLKMLKAHPVYQAIPVIMVTSSRHERDIMESYRCGAAAYFQKPLNYNDFVQLIDCFNAYWRMATLPMAPSAPK